MFAWLSVLMLLLNICKPSMSGRDPLSRPVSNPLINTGPLLALRCWSRLLFIRPECSVSLALSPVQSLASVWGERCCDTVRRWGAAKQQCLVDANAGSLLYHGFRNQLQKTTHCLNFYYTATANHLVLYGKVTVWMRINFGDCINTVSEMYMHLDNYLSKRVFHCHWILQRLILCIFNTHQRYDEAVGYVCNVPCCVYALLCQKHTVSVNSAPLNH